MEVKEKKSENLNDSHLVLFGFELNRSQITVILIFSLVGLFTTTFELAVNIFVNLLNRLFFSIPAYLSEPDMYQELFLYYIFAPVITRIIVFSIFFYLSLYGLKKILRNNNIKNKNKRKIIPQDRIVNWLGLKLSHGQSLFIFCLSLAGILFVIQFYIESTTIMFNFIENLCSIPIGPHSFTWHESFANKSRLIICAIFMVLCLYSLIICRRGKPASPSNRVVKNYGLVIYIVSFIIFLFNLLRLFSHLYFYTDLTIYNVYQTRDFHRTILIAFICFILMISTYFLKESPNEDTNMKNKLTWLRIKLTEKRAIILLSLAIFGITYFSYIFLTLFFIISGFYYNFEIFFLLIIPGIFFIFGYYTIDTVLKKYRLNYFINAIENSEEITCKWFKFNLNRLYSVIFYSLSCGFIALNVFVLIMVGISNRLYSIILGQEFMPDMMIMFVNNAIMTAIISLLLAINIYSIKRTYLSIKSG